MELLGKKREKEKQKSESSSVFLIKLYAILNDNKYAKYIQWSKDGKSLIIFNQNSFTKNVLPHFFNHNNYSSFVRQLNLYNFHKIKTDKKDEHHYMNEQFTKSKTLEEIKRIQRKEKTDENYEKDLLNIKLGEIKPIENKNEIIEKQEEENKIKNFENILKKGELSNDSNQQILSYLLDKSKESIENQKSIKNEINVLITQNKSLIEELKKCNNKLDIENNNSRKMKGMIIYLMRKNFELKNKANKKFVDLVNKYKEYKNNIKNKFNDNKNLMIPKVDNFNPDFSYDLVNDYNQCKFSDKNFKAISQYQSLMNGGRINFMNGRGLFSFNQFMV